MGAKLKLIIKEHRGGFVEKSGEISGTPEKCAAHILEKYGGGLRAFLRAPASEALRASLKEVEGGSTSGQD